MSTSALRQWIGGAWPRWIHPGGDARTSELHRAAGKSASCLDHCLNACSIVITLFEQRAMVGVLRDDDGSMTLWCGLQAQPIFISMFYSDARNATNKTATPAFADITLRDIIVANATGQVSWRRLFSCHDY